MWKDHKSVSLRSAELPQIQTTSMRVEIDTACKPGNFQCRELNTTQFTLPVTGYFWRPQVHLQTIWLWLYFWLHLCIVSKYTTRNQPW